MDTRRKRLSFLLVRVFLPVGEKRFVREEDVASLGTYSFFDAALAQESHVLWTIF